jgi:hypothetical protein
VPCVTAELREKGMGSEVPPAPLGHGPLPPAYGRDGTGINIVESTEDFRFQTGPGTPGAGATPGAGDESAAAAADEGDEHEPRAAPPPAPTPTKSPAPRTSVRTSIDAAPTAAAVPTPVMRSAFGHSGRQHTPPSATPAQRATRVVAKMAEEVMVGRLRLAPGVPS